MSIDKNVDHFPLKTDLIIVTKKNRDVHILNETARLIYLMLRDGKSIEEIKAKIKKDYAAADDGNMDEDIACFMKELEEKGLISLKG